MSTLRTTSDITAALVLSSALWLCSLILIAVFVAPFFGPSVGWVAAIGMLIVLLALCLRIASYRLANPVRPHQQHDRRR
jgi:ABC-type transport system involved in cytochrome bd biosynthesis fused ATPase/permease subunit